MALNKMVYPLSRYWYSDGFRFYYAYGNTPAQDFLQNCSGVKEPTVLVLGCGDIRSCFYSFWKNFDVPQPRFDGVHYVLNDISAAVLARNILFLYLCLQMPEEEHDLRKWLSGMWAIWYCHELYPEHDKLLHDSLDALYRYSEDWSKSDNPLHSIVRFASPATLSEIKKVWKMWLERDVGFSSVEKMHLSRQKGLSVHEKVLKTESDMSDFVLGSTEIPFEQSNDSDKNKARESEIKNYFKNGSVYAEKVLGLNCPNSPTLVNFTLFEGEDGKYSLHYRSIPFSCYYQTVDFSSKQVRSLKVSSLATVADQYFKSFPFLANSFQQFSIWLRSTNKVILSFKHKIQFTFNCSHAMALCYELNSQKKAKQFHLIYTSNLMDHLGPPNLILSAIPLLKDGGFLFTTTLVKDPLSLFESYLSRCFGFDSKLFSILFGIRCINHEGASYASPVSVRPSPFTVRDMTHAHYEKVQVWEKVQLGTTPLIFDPDQPLTDVIARALCGCVEVSAYPLLKPPRICQVMNNLCIETAVKVFQTFMSNSCADFSPQFWKPLTDLLRVAAKPYLHSLQTQLLLHGIHMHLTLSEKACPMCLKLAISSTVGLFCRRVPIRMPYRTPNFFVAVHKEELDDAEHLCSIAKQGGSVHIFDCVSTTADNSDVVELYFYAPLDLSAGGYKVTLLVSTLAKVAAVSSTNLVYNMSREVTVQLSSWLVAFSTFKFFQLVLSARYFKLAAFGTITSHVSDGDSSKVKIGLLERVVAASVTNKLKTKKISLNEIQILCGKISCSIKFPYPVDYDKTSIKISRQTKELVVECPRVPQQFQKEKPLFIMNPEKQLLHFSSASALINLSGQQFTSADRVVNKLHEKDLSQAPPLIALKNTLMYFFQQQDVYCYQFLLPVGGVHGMVLVNKRLFDHENRVPVVDLAFCFLEESFVHTVAPIWVEICSGQACSINVGDREYELLKEVFYYFAGRTDAMCKRIDADSRLHLLRKRGIQKYFTRAVLSLLLYDPDIYGEYIRNIIKTGTGGKPSGAVGVGVASGTATSPHQQKPRCSFCNSSGDLKKCLHCGEARYCDRHCQTQHWPKHKVECRKVGKASKKELPPESKASSTLREGATRCACCGTSTKDLKLCTGCGKVKYCGTECQKKHWKNHKATCN